MIPIHSRRESNPTFHPILLYQSSCTILDHLDNPIDAGELFVRFEIAVLNDLGFGLDLAECVATGTRSDLIYVSPKSGRAVSREAGAPYADRMLALPAFLSDRARAADPDSLIAAFRMTAHFLNRHIFEPRGIGMPAARDGFIQSTLKALRQTAPAAP